MRLARLSDDVGPAGELIFTAERAIADPAERSRLVGYLKGGAVIRRITGLAPDRFDPQRGQIVPISTHTDGEWIWNAAMAYYAEVHGMGPEPEFLAHIRAHGYVAAVPDEAACRQALAELRAAQGG
jgi:hypothetical protein